MLKKKVKRSNEIIFTKIYFSISVSSGKEPACQCRQQETQFWSLGQEDLLEEEMATHFSILVWRIIWRE